jgi:hypothetical protein
MYTFAVVALLGLALMAVVNFLEDLVPGIDRIHTLFTFALGIAGAWALNYSMFSGFHVAVRDAWMGTWGTGLVLAAIGHAWRAVFGWLGYKEVGDAMERHHDRPRIAA